MVMEPDALKKLRQRYRKSAVEFDELSKVGNLPKLKIALSNGGSEGKRPFDNGKRVEWPELAANPAYYTARNASDGVKWISPKPRRF